MKYMTLYRDINIYRLTCTYPKYTYKHSSEK